VVIFVAFLRESKLEGDPLPLQEASKIEFYRGRAEVSFRAAKNASRPFANGLTPAAE
jgi:hypothetical protein